MKLMGSMTEQHFRDSIARSHYSLFYQKSNERLLRILQSNFPDMKTAYFIDHIPEQGEDIYTLIINTNTIAYIELDRYNLDSEPIVKAIPLNEYKQRLSKIKQIELAVAIDLAQKDLKK